jgi:hypothetical protein
MMIAGTYTPFIGQMKGDFVSIGLLIGVWLTAVVGVTLKLLLPGRFDRLAVVLYLILGWSGAVIYEPVAAAFPAFGSWGQAVRYTQRASYSMDGRACGFKMRSGMALYWSPHVVTIRPFFTVWPMGKLENGHRNVASAVLTPMQSKWTLSGQDMLYGCSRGRLGSRFFSSAIDCRLDLRRFYEPRSACGTIATSYCAAWNSACGT